MAATEPASQPVTAAPAHLTNAVLIRDWSWITHHLILLAVSAVMAVGAVYLVESLIAKHDVANASATAQILATQVAQTKAMQAQWEVDQAQWAQTEKALLSQNSQLAKTIETDHAQVVKQRTIDATLTAQEAATRLAQQTAAKPGEVVAQGDAVLLDLPITRSVVSNLDLLAGTQSELINTQTQLSNETTVANNATENVAEQTKIITSLKAQNVDEINSCKAQIAVVKAKDRKSKIKWFFSGVVVGFIGKRLALGSW